MRKRVKRIPKYHNGTPSVGTVTDPKTPKPYVDGFSFSNSIGEHWKNMDSAGQINAIAGGINAAGNMINNATSGEDVTAGGVVTGIGSGALTGAMIGGPWGALIGGAIGGVTSAVGSNYADENGVHNSGLASLVGNSPEWLAFKHNRMRNSVISQLQTENLKADYMNRYGGAVKVAEGGIMGKPINALVSPGEIAIDPITLEYEQFGSNNEEPNSKDNIPTILETGEVVRSHAKHMIMPNGKTSAENSKMVLDSNAPEEMKRVMIKKIGNWESAHRTKPQQYAKFSEGWSGEIKSWDDYLKYSYSLSKNNKIDKLENFWGYNSKNGKYNSRWDDIIKHVGANKALREKAIKDLGGLSYIGTGDDAWDNIVKAAYDTKPADVYRYFKSVGDVLTTQKDPLKQPIVGLGRIINVPKGVSLKNVRSSIGGVDHMTSYIPQQESEKLTKLTPEQIKQFNKNYAVSSPGSQNKSNWLSDIVDFAPLAAAMFRNYDYERVNPRIARNHSIPVDYNVDDILTDNQRAHAINNYNVSQMGGNTGAYLAAANQSAANLMKANAQTRIYQKNKQNELIAKNIAQLNDWGRYANNQMWAADVATDQNQGMAQQIGDQARKDRLEFYYGERNDDMLTAMMKPMFEYGTPDEAYKPVYRRRIV